MKENKFEKTALFILSPLISLPLLLFGIFHKSKYSLLLFVVFFGVLSFLYIPNISNDKANYFVFYDYFKSIDFNGFLDWLIGALRPDFLFHFLIYIFSSIGVSVQYLFFLITAVTTGVWFYLFYFTVEVDNEKRLLSRRDFFLCFLLVLVAIPLAALFSGIRFSFGAAFVFLALYNAVHRRNVVQSFCFLLTGFTIHFSTLLFFPIYILILKFPNLSWYKYLFICSFLFFLMPKSVLGTVIGAFDLTEGINSKKELYLDDELTDKNGSVASIYVFYITIAWSFLAYAYLAFTLHRKSLFRNLIYLTFGVVNFFYIIPVVYSRYLGIAKFLFILLLIHEFIHFKKKKILVFSLILMAFNFIVNLIILRNNIEASFFNKYILSLPLMLFKEISVRDILY